ncbi:MAG: carbohydrate-binding domain-containing protein, partial [Paludibacteraceae bacterium]|nr:carbohydrate-binding domain-containing protein [Paludibacteraceae bacterium]
MKKIIVLIISCFTVGGLLNAQTLNVQVGQVNYQFPADQAGVMNYAEGTTLSIMNKVFILADVATMYVDESAVKDNTVAVEYNGETAAITVAGNVAQYLTITASGAHVNIEQSSELAEEITYTLSGRSEDGEFYMSGSYKATVELNGLTLTNTNPVTSGAAVHIQNGKRIKVKVLEGTSNTLVDAANGSQKGAFYVKGHPEFSGKGTLTVTGNVKHAIKSGEYMTVKDATLVVKSAAGDGINCGQYFLMKSGVLNISGVEDDGIQCDIDDTEVGSTGETADHEDEDSGNIYLEGGQITINTAGIAA